MLSKPFHGLRFALAFALMAAAAASAGTLLAQPAEVAPPVAVQPAPPPQPGPLTAQESALVDDFLRQGPDHGLPDLTPMATDEESRIRALLEQARDLQGERVDPLRIYGLWALRRPHRDLRAEFDRARTDGGLQAWLLSLAPSDPGYQALTWARRRYARVVAEGGWPDLEASAAAVKAGKVDPAVALLRERLAKEGFEAPPEDDPSRFDAPLQLALAAFQGRHGLAADGVLGPATLAALNVPAADRLATIDANLERSRWAPPPAAGPHIDVDIAAQELAYYEPGQAPLRMRIIVGTPSNETPMFASAVDAIVFNPPWNVPTSIARAELWPKEARSPGYLRRHGFAVINGQIRQAPGPRAALGYIKFDIDSPFGVYLHDTPSRSLFERERRTLSHGCIRVQLPRDLAARLLAPQGWTREGIDAAIAARATRRVSLDRTVPVVLAYRTAEAEPDGTVTFRPDVYGWDARLLAALARQPAAAQALLR